MIDSSLKERIFIFLLPPFLNVLYCMYILLLFLDETTSPQYDLVL